MAFFIAGLPCVSIGSTAAADCPPAVVVYGPARVRTAITDELGRSGVDLTPLPGCIAEDVTVKELASGLSLRMIDAYGRATRRTVGNVPAAVAVIESRIGVELLVPLLPVEEVVPGGGYGQDNEDGKDGNDSGDLVAQAVPLSTAPEIVAKTTPSPEMHPASHSVTLFAAAEMAAGSDDSAWAGLSVSGCVTLGPTCLGTLIRFWQDLDARDESANVIRGRAAGEVAVSLDLPFSRGRLAFRPGVELGISWIHMGGFGAHTQMIDDNEFDHGDVSAGLHIAASLQVWRHWSVEGGSVSASRCSLDQDAIRHRRRDAPGRAARLRAGLARSSLRSPMTARRERPTEGKGGSASKRRRVGHRDVR